MQLTIISDCRVIHAALRKYFDGDIELRHIESSGVRTAPVREWSRMLRPSAAVLIDWHEETRDVLIAVKKGIGPHGVPLIALCSSNEAEHVAALVVGADDVLVRPLRPTLLQARLLAYARGERRGEAMPPGDALGEVREAPSVTVAPAIPPDHDVQTAGPLILNTTARLFFLDETPVDLTPKEFDLMAFLMDRPGACCTRDQILDEVWGVDFDTGTNILDVHIYGLRSKLREHGVSGVIETVRGVGYRLAFALSE